MRCDLRATVANPSKAKGTKAEGEVLRWLVGVTGYPLHRNVLHGAVDIGDIGGMPDAMIECKAGAPKMAQWLRELDRQTTNLGTRWGFLVWRTPGSTDPHDWVVIARPDQWLRPRFPIPGPMSRLPYYVRRIGQWSPGGGAYLCNIAGFRCDGFMPTSIEDCHAVAMTGAAFETWLGDNLRPDAYDEWPERTGNFA